MICHVIVVSLSVVCHVIVVSLSVVCHVIVVSLSVVCLVIVVSLSVVCLVIVVSLSVVCLVIVVSLSVVCHVVVVSLSVVCHVVVVSLSVVCHVAIFTGTETELYEVELDKQQLHTSTPVGTTRVCVIKLDDISRRVFVKYKQSLLHAVTARPLPPSPPALEVDQQFLG